MTTQAEAPVWSGCLCEVACSLRGNASSPLGTQANLPSEVAGSGILSNVSCAFIVRSDSQVFSLCLRADVVKSSCTTSQQPLKHRAFTQAFAETLQGLTEKWTGETFSIRCMCTELHWIPHQNNTWSLEI